jgi:hypothetical protein
VIANPFIGSLIGFLYFCAGSSSAIAIYAKLSNPHYYPMWVGFSLQRSKEPDARIGFFRQFQAFLRRMKNARRQFHLLSLGSRCIGDPAPKVGRHALDRGSGELPSDGSWRDERDAT